MMTRYYLANCYPRINDESAPEYEARLKRLAHSLDFSEKCAVNFHTECWWDAQDCHCKCHEETDTDEQLRSKVIEHMRTLWGDYPLAPDGELEETAQKIINLIRSNT